MNIYKARFLYDSLNIHRLYYPKIKLYFKFIIISWKLALVLKIKLIIKKINKYINIYTGPYTSIETNIILKILFNQIGLIYINFENNKKIIADLRFTYLFNKSIKKLNLTNTFIIIGCNLRLEAPILNSYIRKSFVNQPINTKVYFIGGCNFLTFPVINISSSTKNLLNLFNGISIAGKYFILNNYYSSYIINYKNNITLKLIIGGSLLNRIDYYSFINLFINFINKFKLKFNLINIVQRFLGKLSFLEINLKNNILYKKKTYKKNTNYYYLIGIDKIKNNILISNFNTYQGFFYINNLFKLINLILPSSIYCEENYVYINLEGRFRNTNKILNHFKFIFNETSIITGFSIFLNKFFIENFSILLKFNILIKFNILLIYKQEYLKKIRNYIYLLEKNKLVNKEITLHNFKNTYCYKFLNTIFAKTIYNYYSSDIFSQKSKILILASKKISYINFSNN